MLVDIKGFDGNYAVTPDGRVWSRYIGRWMSPTPIQGGYLTVGLRREGKQIRRLVHRLVAEAYIGDCPDLHEVNHIDGDKLNNRVENLEYTTRLANMQHAWRTGLIGKQVGRPSKLTENQVVNIYHLNRSGIRQTRLASLYEVSDSTVSNIIRGERWKHLGLVA